MWEGFALAAIAALGWWWYDSMRARERALATAGAACARDGLQFLDETVECVATRPARDRPAHAPAAEEPPDSELPGWTHTYSGKVRDLYLPSAGSAAALINELRSIARSGRMLKPEDIRHAVRAYAMGSGASSSPRVAASMVQRT